MLAIKAAIDADHERITPSISSETEIIVIKREIEIMLVKEGIKLIEKHDEALKGALEMGAADNQINAFLQPYQQFASTLYETVDRNPHLDIVSKASFVQQFLTRLRNRCTNVETLTSGPGVVFSMKDFNDCIQTLCRGMIKYCETNIRSLTETNVLRTEQLHHLVYINERKMLYYKNKCENFVNEIDNLINAKMAEKNTALIYELDITHRELRMLKDSYFLMEKMMREAIRKEFIDDINNKDFVIQKLKQGFGEFRHEIDARINARGYQEILDIGPRIKAMANVYKMTEFVDSHDKQKRLDDADRKAVLKMQNENKNVNKNQEMLPRPTLQSKDFEVKLNNTISEVDERSNIDDSQIK